MEDLIGYLQSGHTMTDIMMAIVVIASLISGLELAIVKAMKWFSVLFNKKTEQNNAAHELEQNTHDIEELTNSINALSEQITVQYDKINERIEKIDSSSKKRDCAILRDRILQATSFYKNRSNDKEEDNVMLSLSEHENLSHLFDEYFDCGGNGSIKKIYDNEFSNWDINTK